MGTFLKALSGLADGLAVALGVICLAAAVLAHGGRFSTRLDVLTHFAPFWLIGAAVALVWGLVVSAPGLRPVTAGMGGLGVLAAGLLILPELIRPISPNAPADAPHQLKIVQFNGWSQNIDVNGTADWIAAQNPDVVVVEEIEAPLREAILKRLPYHVSRGMLHVSIFSRTEPLHRAFQITGDWEKWPGMARARLAAPDGGAFDIVGVHFTWPTRPWQVTERDAVASMLRRYDSRRLILVGDFNLTPWSFTLRGEDKRLGLERRDRAMFSWPAQAFGGGRLYSPIPFLPIDHVYAGSDWRTVSIVRGPRVGSDHFPVVVTLALKN